MRKLYIFCLIGVACIIVGQGCAGDYGASSDRSTRAAAESARTAEMKKARMRRIAPLTPEQLDEMRDRRAEWVKTGRRQRLDGAELRTGRRPGRPGAGRPQRSRLTAEQREQRSAMIARMRAEGASGHEIRRALDRMRRAQRRLGEQAPAGASLYSPPDSPKRRVREFNTLKYAILDPGSGSIILLGTYDPRYPTGPIPYYDLLKDAMHSPYPRFSLDATRETEQAEDTVGRALKDDVARMWRDDAYCEAWTNRLMALLMDAANLPIDHRRFVQKASEALQITPEDFVRLYAHKQHPVKPIPQDIIQIHVKMLRGAGLDDVAELGLISHTENRKDFLSALDRMGVRQEVEAFHDKQQAGLISEAQMWQEIEIFLVSRALRNYNVPEREIRAKGEQVRRGRMTLQALYDFQGEQFMAFLSDALGPKLFHGLSLSHALLQELYNVPTPQIKLTFIDMPPESVLGDVLFRADYALKYVDATPEVKEKVPGHLSGDEFVFQQFSAQGVSPSSGCRSGAVRSWLTPGEVKMSVAPDGSVISFGQAKVRINTELEDVTGMNPRVEAVYRDAVNRYGIFLTARYDQYARIFPELHRLREAAKLLALTRWATSNNYRVVVDQAQGITLVPPKTTSGFWSTIFLANEKRLSMVLSSNGGVSFGQSQGERWVSVTPDAEVKNNVLDQLVASATLAEQAADAALAGDLEGAHALAEQSAQAMTGEIKFTELPALREVPMPLEPAAHAARCVEVLAATDDNITALQTAQADQQRAAAIEQQSPAEAARLRDSAADRQRTAEEHLQALREGRLWSIPTSSPTTRPIQLPAKPEPTVRSLRERWLAELSTLRAEVRHIQEMLGRLDKSRQNDQEQRKEWEKTTSEAYARALDAAKNLIMDLVVDLPDGYFNDKLRGAITLKERERFERALRLVEQLKELRNVKDFAAWASNEEFGREEVIDGVKMIAGILLQDEKLVAKLVPKNVLIIKTAAERIINSSYDITAEVLSWRAINQLNKNSQAYLDAVKALQARLFQVFKRITELKDKLEAMPEEE